MLNMAVHRKKKLKAPTILLTISSLLIIKISIFISDLFDIISIDKDMGMVTTI